MKINPKDILRPTLTLFIICIIAAAALSVSNLVTADKIAQNEQDKLQTAMQQVLQADDYEQVALENVDDDTSFYVASQGATTVGYTALCTKTGYGGKVKVMVGIDTQGVVKKIAIVSADDETPGLGQNIKTDEFLSRFNDITDANSVDAWTGATISSTAVKDAVTQALELFALYTTERN